MLLIWSCYPIKIVPIDENDHNLYFAKGRRKIKARLSDIQRILKFPRHNQFSKIQECLLQYFLSAKYMSFIKENCCSVMHVKMFSTLNYWFCENKEETLIQTQGKVDFIAGIYTLSLSKHTVSIFSFPLHHPLVFWNVSICQLLPLLQHREKTF